MEAASTSETSVNFYQATRRNNPDDSHLHTRRRENHKSHSSTWDRKHYQISYYRSTIYLIPARFYNALLIFRQQTSRATKRFFLLWHPRVRLPVLVCLRNRCCSISLKLLEAWKTILKKVSHLKPQHNLFGNGKGALLSERWRHRSGPRIYDTWCPTGGRDRRCHLAIRVEKRGVVCGVWTQFFSDKYPNNAHRHERTVTADIQKACPKSQSINIFYARFAVLTAVKMSMLVFWVVTPCGLVCKYQPAGGTYCLHLQSLRWMQYATPKFWYLQG
jgi:hypothetical protein